MGAITIRSRSAKSDRADTRSAYDGSPWGDLSATRRLTRRDAVSGLRVKRRAGTQDITGANEADQLSRAFHNRAEDSVDPGRVALAIFHEPVVNFFVDAGGHEHLRSTFELR